MQINYRDDIDGLRAISIMGVVLYHIYGPILPGGFAGVDIFFVISGFLISSILISDYDKGELDIVKFWFRRALRLLPALYIMIIVTSFFAYIIYRPAELVIFSKAGLSSILYYSNFFFWKTINYFEPDVEDHPLIHTWSLSVEEQFYFFAPLLLIAASKLHLNKKYLFYCVIIIVVSSFMLNCYGPFKNTVAQFYLLPTRAWELGIGAICSFAASKLENKENSTYLMVLRLLALSCILGYFIFYNEVNFYPNITTLIPVASTFILLITRNNDFINKILTFKVLVKIGLMSYSLYLWHNPILSFGMQFDVIKNATEIYKIVILSLTILIFSYLSFEYIEKPFRQNYFKRLKLITILAVSVMLCLYFITTVMTTGFINRYADGNKDIAGLNATEAGRFVERRFNSLLNNNFETNVGKRILVVGDSFAQDVVNVVSYSALSHEVDIATVYISARCGNLYLPWVELQSKIQPRDIKYCDSNLALINNNRFKYLANLADEIWFISRWQEWQVDLIERSLNFMKMDYSTASIVFFGGKNLGEVNLRKLVNLKPSEKKLTFGNELSVNQLINSKLQKNIKKHAEFFDTQSLICGIAKNQCPLFDDNGKIISYDGEHLTKDGAMLIGSRFFR